MFLSNFASVSVGAWVVASAWLIKVVTVAWGLPRVPNLLLGAYDRFPAKEDVLTVIVPARNEEEHIVACIESLLRQEYRVKIIAVDDRSTDSTGLLMDQLAAANKQQLTVLHLVDLPEGWLGKTHAMAVAAQHACSRSTDKRMGPEFLLFTDADVVFRKESLRRAVAHAEATKADHLVLMPTALVHRWDEAIVLGAFQILGMWAVRPWRVADRRSLRDAIGVGAFNLLRRTAYDQIGGFEALRMEILEDLTLARRVKKAGLRQRIAFGKGMVEVHWASGARGILGVMTKNLFAVFSFHMILVAGACIWLLLFCVAPAPAIFYPATRIPSLITLFSVVWAYRLYGQHSGIRAWNALWFPVGALLFIAGLLNSTSVTMRQGGVRWRGTFYPLADLRRKESVKIC